MKSENKAKEDYKPGKNVAELATSLMPILYQLHYLTILLPPLNNHYM